MDVASILVVLLASASHPTDFGIRRIPGYRDELAAARVSPEPARSPDLGSAAALGSKWGTVTSTTRSVAHNRRVGGVPNSYHLRSRAIDIARRPGVSHSQIASAYRAAGYRLVESLDEGDHSHFAFGAEGSAARTGDEPSGSTNWKLIYAPR